jgi:amino acid transporter
MSKQKKLKRTVTLPFLILYGLGTMVGGGFYALLGKVSGEAGCYAPLALGLAGIFALISGLAFAELSSRYPVSAGEVRYVNEAFDRRWLSRLTGVFVVLTGVVSAATLAVATDGFLQDFFTHPKILGVTLLVIAMGVVAAWGISESVALVTFITVIEVGALVYAFGVAGGSINALDTNWQQFVPPLQSGAWLGIFSASFLAFYAFIGFEDMVNIAEEVKNPTKIMPIAIIVSVTLTTLLYILVSSAALLSVSPEQLASSNTPIAEMVKEHGWYSSTGLSMVSLLTGINGALVQMIMASRVTYGMAKREYIPAYFSKVHLKTQTPLRATIVITSIVLLLALLFPLVTLAKVTSGIILFVFTLVNFSLWKIKQSNPDPDADAIRLPNWLPLLGGVGCVLALGFQIVQGLVL